MKFLISNRAVNKSEVENFPSEEVHLLNVGPLTILTDDQRQIKNTDSHIYIIDGYIRDLRCEKSAIDQQEANAISFISEQWPIPENITGSFAATFIGKQDFQLGICNDPIGVYPIYYLIEDEVIYISNSIIWLGVVSSCPLDPIGIYQRSTGPEYSNIGTRTILENCKRLLPGEYLKLSSEGKIICRRYDNTLYQNVRKTELNSEIVKEYWKILQEEIKYCLGDSGSVNIALSGGIDSRVILGGIPKDINLTCLTFGDENNYETKIASKLSKLSKADFRSFSDLTLFFPKKEILERYTYDTEAAYLMSWLEILENIDEKSYKQPLFIGDLTTAITGRAISTFSSKEYQQKNFIRHNILKQDYTFTKASPENFIIWKKTVTQNFQIWYNEKTLTQFGFEIDLNELKVGLTSDLEEIFERIKDHNLPYAELYDELFSWYVHSRIPIGKQILFCNKKFTCFSPSMSTRVLRSSSNIHPNHRLSLRFVKKLIQESEEMKKLSKVPTSQAPLLPQNFPEILKFPMWGLRYKIDQYLIKRMVKAKDVSKRYRLFRSMNWAMIYQNPEMESNLISYFKEDHLGIDFTQNLVKKCVKRKELEAWPFANTDVMSIASLNIELDLIMKLRG